MREEKTHKKDKLTAIGEPQRDGGFTLIEVLVAISIFAVGLLAVGTMQLSAINVNSTANQITTRTTWAQDKLEKLMALPYSDPWIEDLGDPPGTDTADNAHQETTPDGIYTISWTVTDDHPAANTKLITVSATGRGKTTRLSCVKTQL